MSRVPSVYYSAAWYQIKAEFLKSLNLKISVSQDFWWKVAHQQFGKSSVEVSYQNLIALTKPFTDYLFDFSYKSFYKTLTLFASCYFFIFLFFGLSGRFRKQKTHISGKQISPVWRIKFRLWIKGKASKIKIGGLPLVKNTETQHILITGGTGSGKSNCMHHILAQIRSLGQRAVIIDTTGIYKEKYFRKGKDFLLNPTDSNGEPWHPWIECENPMDYDAIAENFIPNSNSEQENYWRTAGRSVFSSLLQKTEISKKTSDLSKWILFESLQKLSRFLEGTEATAHIDMSSEKTAGSVRSVTSSFLKCLKYVEDTDTPFSIRKWVQNDKKDDSWLFLSCDPGERAAFIPLVSCWFSVAARSLLRTKPDFDRRLWFVIDELSTLHKLKELEPLLAESRKYGGCALLALQSPAQIEDIYGRAACRTILGLCATKIIFSEMDSETAERISKSFGNREFKEMQESVSYGAHEMRDGVSLSSQIKQQPLVSTSEIHALEANQCFIKLFGNIPVAKLKIKISK